MKEIIWVKNRELDNCFVRGGYTTLTITTIIMKKKILWWYKYKIKQSIPYISGPVYRGDEWTNCRLEYAAKEDRVAAEIEINKIKNDNTKNKNRELQIYL